MEKRNGGRRAEGQSRGAGRARGKGDRRDPASENTEDTSRRHGHRHGAEHGGLGEVPRDGTGRDDDYSAARGGAGQCREFLYRESAFGAGKDSLHDQGARAGDLSAAFHASGVPVRGRERLARGSEAGGLYRSGGAFRDGQDGGLGEL